ncbi:epidermal growth factor receptor substrate 15-like isoform X2 [Phyllopteryx taeniolatus]|uniref:epidermal growth factor receptor substrate 15-like isoform X2 n=1 Tax=Phyllopteryx taeniolatus TaxID=161469 RepID=UPI002AD3F904|nr:epidermal growth factor receptor substrate 15-like isoform X2 [Phyllopteryx taeniolatus]
MEEMHAQCPSALCDSRPRLAQCVSLLAPMRLRLLCSGGAASGAMEERAAQRAQLDGSWEGGHDEGKADWKKECSLSSLLKHSCLLCWSSPRDADIVETDERVLSKASEIRELENAVAVENLELQEQRSDREELEETLVKLEKHKEKLTQQIKATRQLCYEESQQILSLQAEEVKRESQVEEYERELARARWRLRKLKEEVKQAKRKMEEAGERNCPLRDSIRQSYDEILQEERTLCCVSGGAVTPESQLDGSTSPADTAEEEPLPMRPWGRSQSLPAYADLIMVASSAPFCNNLADTREEVDDSSSSSPKMDRSNLEDDPEEGVATSEEQGGLKEQSVPNKLDFYQADPFAHCQISHDLFHEDLFPKTDSSDGFTSDPFKGTDPFAADILFPEANIGRDEGAVIICDEADASLSCAENKASTGTQCFESEFPDEDSDIELSYSQEDFDTIPGADGNHGFKPIQSSSEELGPEPIRCWNSQGQYSVESDPNGYELDLGAVSLPSDIKSTVLDLLLENLPMWQRQKWRKPNLSLSLVIKHCWCRTEETGKTTFIPLMVILEKQVIG